MNLARRSDTKSGKITQVPSPGDSVSSDIGSYLDQVDAQRAF